jgi:transcriptional regulator with XRE-family HTH domain
LAADPPVPRAMLRAARAGLGLTVVDLARRAGVGEETVRRVENGAGRRKGGAATHAKLRAALEAAGATFLPADAERGPGVRFREQGR